MRQRLIWKVIALNFPVIALVIGVIWLSIDYLAADYFTELMNQYQIAPEEIHRMFLASVHQYLAVASAVAIILAVIVSYLLSNRVLRPLNEVSKAIGKMSAGDRDARARTLSRDELGDLAQAFNRMAEEVKQVEKLRENMVADVAHELRTPLTNIRGYVEGLRDQVIMPSDHNLHVLEEETLRLGELVESLLKLSRADAAEFSLTRERFDIHKTIAIAIERHAERIQRKQLKLDVCPTSQDRLVVADQEKIQVIVSNFILNACQYSPKGGTISIRCEWKNRAFRLCMSNASDHITPDDLPFIFERFYRSEKSRSRNSGGAGIGLAIVKKLVEAHNGSVGANIEGDVFTVWFSIPEAPSKTVAALH